MRPLRLESRARSAGTCQYMHTASAIHIQPLERSACDKSARESHLHEVDVRQAVGRGAGDPVLLQVDRRHGGVCFKGSQLCGQSWPSSRRSLWLPRNYVESSREQRKRASQPTTADGAVQEVRLEPLGSVLDL